MPGIVERIKQTKALLEATASLVVLLLQYVALSTFVTLPQGPSAMARILSVALTITVALIIFMLSSSLKKARPWRVALLALGFVVVGAAMVLDYSSYAGRYVKTEPATCTESRPEPLIVPAAPSADLNGILEVHGDYETAFCDVRDQGWLRRTIESENDAQTTNLVVRLVLSQLLLVVGILLAAWKLILHSRAPAPAPAAPPPGNDGSG